jgi:DNA-binding MarR family transcriptional regulator
VVQYRRRDGEEVDEVAGDVRATAGAPRPAGPDVPSPPTGPDAPLVVLLHELGHHLHAVGIRFAAREALHPTDVQALSVLALAGGELTAGELARSLELSSGATTRLVDRLEEVGHVTRRADEVDRRRRHVAISPTAAATAGSYFGRLAEVLDTVVSRYDASEQATIRRFLTEVIAVVGDHASLDP